MRVRMQRLSEIPTELSSDRVRIYYLEKSAIIAGEQ